MLTFHVITLFPELIEQYCSTSIIGRGMREGRIGLMTYNPRAFCLDKYKKVDDTPYGGGAGMVMKPEPIFAALESISRSDGAPVLLMTPQGKPFEQAFAHELSQATDIVLICGHYEGFDERIRSFATHEVSIGDFVLTGGEMPALAVIDAVGRLMPGVLGKSISLVDESFESGLLEAPQYTKPFEFRGMCVPEILRSGDHKAVAQWRRREALRRTLLRRPDLIDKAKLDKHDQRILQELQDENGSQSGF